MKSFSKKNILTHPLSIRTLYAITWGLASTYRFRVINRSPWLNHLTSGGRVLNVTALGATVADAKERADLAIGGISWTGGFHRNDIGWRAIAREQGRSE